MVKRTAVIIEDEKDAQELLASIIKNYSPDIEVLGCASNLNSAQALIEEAKPDIVFLDIQLGDCTGFQVLDSLASQEFKLIITTAYEDFALRAFQYHAVDYILKPYSPKSIVSALGRLGQQNTNTEVFEKLERLLMNQQKQTKLSLPTNEGYMVVNPADIIYLLADRSYCEVYLIGNRKIHISKSLKEIEAKLPSDSFFRLHTSYVINLNHIDKYCKEDGGYVFMTNGAQVPIARRRKQEFLTVMKT